MHFESREPANHLKGVVREYWIFENPESETHEQKIIPDGFSEIIIHYGDPFEINNSGVWKEQERLLYSNQISKHFYLRNTGRSAMLGIKLQPTGFFRLFGNSQSEFTDKVISLNGIIDVPDSIAALVESHWSTDERIKCIESWLTEKLTGQVISQIPEVCDFILEKRGLISVEELATEFSISTRHLEREFKKSVGITPKLYIRIIKFSHIFNVMQEDKPWVQVALQSGYFDQSHFIKNFKAFTGEDPSKYGFSDETLANFFLNK